MNRRLKTFFLTWLFIAKLTAVVLTIIALAMIFGGELVAWALLFSFAFLILWCGVDAHHEHGGD